MRRGALAALLLAACASTPPAPQALLQQGRVAAALAAAWSHPTDPAQKDAAVRAALRRAAPRLSLALVAGDELARDLGVHTARQILGSHAVVRATLESAAADLPADEVDLVFEAPGGKLPLVPATPEALTGLTGEHYPSGHEWTEWKFAQSPFDPGKATDPIGALGNLVGAIIFAPIQLLSLHSETHYDPPTDQEIAAAVPRAARAAVLLAGKPDAQPRVRYFVVRRPARPETPVTLRIAASVGAGAIAGLRAKAELTLGPAATLLLEPLASETFLGRGKPVEATCQGYQRSWERRLEAEAGPCELAELAPQGTLAPIGLAPPPRPPALGTPAASAARCPWWADCSRYAPDSPIPKATPLPAARADEEAALLVCEEHGLASEVYPVVRFGKDEWARSDPDSRFTVPLAYLGGASTIVVDLRSHSSFLLIFTSTSHHGALTLARKGADVVVKAAAPPTAKDRVSCVGLGQQAVDALLEERWAAATDALDGLEEVPFRVDPRLSDFGRSRCGLAHAQPLIEAAASLVGWDDPRVAALVGRQQALNERFGAAVKRAVEAWEALLAQREREAQGRDGGVEVEPQREVELKPIAVRCDERVAELLKASESTAGGRCVIDAELTNHDKFPRFPGMMLHAVRVVLDDGSTADLEPVGKDEQLAPGATRPVVLASSGAAAPSRASRPWRLVERQMGSADRPVALPAP